MIPGQPPQPSTSPTLPVYRQPLVYIAVPTGQNSIPSVNTGGPGQQVVQNTMPTDPNQHKAGQICTCPPEVHKALMEGRLIPNMKTLRIPTSHLESESQTSTSVLATSTPVHTSTSSLSLNVPKPTVISPTLVANVGQPQGYRPVQLILIPTSSSAGLTQYMVSPNVANLKPKNELASTDRPQVPPDVLVTSAQTKQHAFADISGQTGQEIRIPVSCMESQLAHLSAWVQQLQKSPGTTITSHQLAGYSHRYCGANACRVAEGQTKAPSLDTELSYTPSNSSLDSAYSNRSTTSSDSGHNRGELVKPHLMPALPEYHDAMNHPVRPQPQAVSTEAQNVKPVNQLGLDPTATHPEYCHVITVPNYSGPVNQTLIGQYRAEIQLLKNKLRLVQTELSNVRSELSILRRAEQAGMTQHREAIESIKEQVKRLTQNSIEIDNIPVQLARRSINRELSVYSREALETDEWIRDLDMAIEDLRVLALTRRSRIHLPDIETLNLHLTRVGHRLKNFKDELPKICGALRRVMDAELRNISRNQKFIDTESNRIDEALERCKQMTSTLFTLKRLGAVQEHSVCENIPCVRTVREPTADDRRKLMDRINTLIPDHQARERCIQEFEKLTKCKKRLANPEASTHFGRTLRFSEDPLHSTDFDDPETEMNCLPSCDELEQAGEVSSKRTAALNEMSQNLSFAPSPAYAHPSWTDQTRLQEIESHCLREETQITPKIQMSSNSQEDLHQVEPNSLLEDEMVPASPDTSKHQRKRSPSSSVTIPQPSVHKAPTILKWTGPSANLRSSTLCSSANHVRNRRSRVVFSRTVMVSNGLETTQLNCPSETDDEDDPDFHPACPRLTLDDMVINRTSEPWHSASRFDTKSCKQSSRQHTRFLRALETFTRPDRSENPFYNYLLDNSTDPVVSGTEKSTPVVQRPRHHHNCQALRQNTKAITSPADVMFGSFN
ncbi:coiled-coil domain-containing protein CG32809 [Clonorchis sinensis]|uniref:Coiled-coil domain-containing protein CG32809 n=1 Tax=Clonorchis sinensis TaxID=79923 RepID=G7YAC7_CLOSI|nr:coiled-coil domain-containing protein CG32809 [Clonorchis sinensis]